MLARQKMNASSASPACIETAPIDYRKTLAIEQKNRSCVFLLVDSPFDFTPTDARFGQIMSAFAWKRQTGFNQSALSQPFSLFSHCQSRRPALHLCICPFVGDCLLRCSSRIKLAKSNRTPLILLAVNCPAQSRIASSSVDRISSGPDWKSFSWGENESEWLDEIEHASLSAAAAATRFRTPGRGATRRKNLIAHDAGERRTTGQWSSITLWHRIAPSAATAAASVATALAASALEIRRQARCVYGSTLVERERVSGSLGELNACPFASSIRFMGHGARDRRWLIFFRWDKRRYCLQTRTLIAADAQLLRNAVVRALLIRNTSLFAARWRPPMELP